MSPGRRSTARPLDASVSVRLLILDRADLRYPTRRAARAGTHPPHQGARHGRRSPRRDLGLELSVGQGHLEWRVLSEAPTARIRRARVLRRALRQRRGELDILRAAARSGLPRLVEADA